MGSRRLPALDVVSRSGSSTLGRVRSDFSIQSAPNSLSSSPTAATLVGRSSNKPALVRTESGVSSFRGTLQRSKSQMKLLSTSVIRIVSNGHLVKHEELKTMKAAFDGLDKNNTGYVEYAKLAEGNGRSMFSQNFLKKISTAQEDIDRPQGVFSFRDMLTISYPLASPGEIQEMEEFATKGSTAHRMKKAKDNATVLERQEAEAWYREISDEDGLIFLDSLEDFLNTSCPFMNVYQYLKTMEPPILKKLYDDEAMSRDEFIYWHLTTAVAQRTAEENITKVKHSGAVSKAKSGGLRRGG
mmetsp:Transcript_16029/g.28509  ORF Transcript_16029/g.28509 Transcript_16029/m.28509 type:complete len:299 (-) Transcript_16029:91-987(-)